MKLKIIVHMERVFEPMLEFYDNPSAESVLKMELKSYEEDPGYLLEYEDTMLSVKGEIIEP